jgi:hypothetical protein
MSRRLHENLSSSYLEAAQRLRPKNAKRKIVAYVESYDDVFFWRSLLCEFENDKYVFEVMLPSHDTLQKGKKSVLMNTLGNRLGTSMIACVDADYDYLLQDTTETSRTVNGNPFVFHTYVYAIESYECYAETLHDVCVMATLNDHEIIDFAAFLHAYSEIIFPLFVWNVWGYRYGCYSAFTLIEFVNMVNIEKVNIHNLPGTLEYIRHVVNRKINWLQQRYPQGKATYAPLRDEILALGVTPETTYMFMQGHGLMDGVVMPLLDPVCKQLRKEREREIKELACHAIQEDNELSAYQHSQEDITMMLRKHTFFKSAPLYQRMRDDIRKFLDKLDLEK